MKKIDPIAVFSLTTFAIYELMEGIPSLKSTIGLDSMTVATGFWLSAHAVLFSKYYLNGKKAEKALKTSSKVKADENTPS